MIDPLDQRVAGLAGRGKRVTLRDTRQELVADSILGKPVEGKAGYRYVRVPGQKRTYAAKTEAEPKVTIQSYSVDERLGRLTNLDTVALTREGGQWKLAGAERLNTAAVEAMAAALDNLKIVDVRPKPPSLAKDLRSGRLELSLETAVSLRQKGFLLTPNGRLLASEGEMAVETANGLVYVLRFGEMVGTPGGENRYLLVTVSFDAARAAKYGGDSASGERQARELTNRLADWYYVISGAEFAKLRLKRKDVVR